MAVGHCAKAEDITDNVARLQVSWRKLGNQCLGGQSYGWQHLLQDSHDALFWVVRLQRDICATSYQDSVDRNNHAQASFEKQRHHAVKSDAVVLLQPLCQLPAHRAKLPVGVRLVNPVLATDNEGNTVRVALGMLDKEPVHLPGLKLAVVRLVRPLQQGRLLLRISRWEVGKRRLEPLRGRSGEPAEEEAELALQVLSALVAEELLPVQQLDGQVPRTSHAEGTAAPWLHAELQGKRGCALRSNSHGLPQTTLLLQHGAHQECNLEQGVQELV
mmetsp:Transcript_43391/g.123753  ORF Transcript_43391/g.123753 Transcript_43391/m.123753 type:complete len:273 (+) Transcript_43391:626-1444(+)